jgi:hypothetical protein
MSDVAVITRAYDAEIPYIKSFIRHYAARGCEEFHLVIPKGNSFQALKKHCEGIDNINFHIAYEGFDKLIGCQNAALRHVKSSHILNVDVDEYLDTPSLRAATEHDYVCFRWAIVPFPSREFHYSPSIVDGQCKYLVRTEICEYLHEHDCGLSRPIRPKISDKHLVHYAYRSFNDLLLKCACSNYGTHEMVGIENLKGVITDIRLLPNKFKTASIYARLANASDTRHKNFCHIDDAAERTLIAQYCRHYDVESLEWLFNQYQSRIDVPRFLRSVFKSKLYKEYGRLPHFKLAEHSDKTLSEQLTPQNWITGPRKGTSLLSSILRRLFNPMQL